jgi:hypothetical protein
MTIMKKKYYWIVGIIIFLILFSILYYTWTATSFPGIAPDYGYSLPNSNEAFITQSSLETNGTITLNIQNIYNKSYSVTAIYVTIDDWSGSCRPSEVGSVAPGSSINVKCDLGSITGTATGESYSGTIKIEYVPSGSTQSFNTTGIIMINGYYSEREFQYAVESANYSNGVVVATVKNIGSVEIKIESAFVNNVLSKINSTIYPIEPNETETIDILNATEACGSTLDITIEKILNMASATSISC